ncbi:MAG: hypothetical protein M3O20_01360 [Acidobacteriota bacterium]|nr:hypothetical protein [Acidobacteriota bacterium]
MPSYRIHRLKDHLQQSFRLAPHVSGTAHVKPRDYEPGESIDAPTPYAAFFVLKDTEGPLLPGDLLEAENGALRIYKFVGFEEAQWLLPESKPDTNAEPVLATSTGA